MFRFPDSLFLGWRLAAPAAIEQAFPAAAIYRCRVDLFQYFAPSVPLHKAIVRIRNPARLTACLNLTNANQRMQDRWQPLA
jgi:hypothetical protein